MLTASIMKNQLNFLIHWFGSIFHSHSSSSEVGFKGRRMLMLNVRTLSTFGRIINFGHKLDISPYKYEESCRRVNFNKSSKYWIVLILSTCLTNLWICFLIRQFVLGIWDDKVSGPQNIKTLYMAAIYILYNVNPLMTLKHYGQHHKYINAFLQVAQDSGQFETLQNARSTELLILHTFSTQLCFAALSFGLAIFQNPELKVLFSSLLENPRHLSLPVKAAIGFIHFYILAFQLYSLLLNCATVLCYVAAVLGVLNKMILIKNEDQSHLEFLRRCSKELEVLQQNFTVVYGFCPLEMEVAGIFVLVINIFLGTVTREIRPLVISFLVSAVILSFLNRFSLVNSTSVTAIESWARYITIQPESLVVSADSTQGQGQDEGNRHRRSKAYWSKWFQRFVKSCRPLRVNLGDFFVARKTLILMTIYLIVSNATNLIIAYRGA